MSRVGRIKYVTRNDEGIGPLLLDCVQEPLKKKSVLSGTVVVMQAVAQVPVGGVQYAHNEKWQLVARNRLPGAKHHGCG
jgi:hypothetical protein